MTGCATCGLTVYEAKTESMCQQTNDGSNATAGGQVYKETVEIVYSAGGLSSKTGISVSR